jgi:NADPH:quinone reductase-like Zn-dependent oxidoreductase
MNIPPTMMAVVTTGNGGFDKLDYRRVPTPVPEPGEVLVQVLAAGVNNTEINTRLGWYSKVVTTGTINQAGIEEDTPTHKEDGGWNLKTPFPFIQGTDCCGRVVALGDGADQALMGRRIIIRACMRGPEGFDSIENIWMASDFDGAFAQFVKVPAPEVFPVECDWSDVELGAIPCAYGSAESMLVRAGVTGKDRVLVPGASGGVGSATVQLAKARGCHVTAICGPTKVDQVRALGADQVLGGRPDQPGWQEMMSELHEAVDAVVDNVGGKGFPFMVEALKRGGRYATSGAISGPIAELDLRTMYLKDITLHGCTAWDEPTFPNLVKYIEAGKIRPVIAKTYPLEQIAEAQRVFLLKEHVGKFVLLPSPVEE